MSEHDHSRSVARFDARANLLAAALDCASSEFHFQARTGNPHEDAEMEYREDGLVDAARAFAEAYKDYKTALESYREKQEPVAQIAQQAKTGKRSLMCRLVRLTTDAYSVPEGSIGVIDHPIGEHHYFVNWMGPFWDGSEEIKSPFPTPGGSSGPIRVGDLEPLGLLVIPIEE